MILGPIVGLRKPEYVPEPAPGETSREIFQARRGIQEANEGMKDLRESQEKLTSSVESIAKNTAEAQRKLTAVLAVLNQRVKRLEGDNSTAGDEQPQAKTTGPGEEDVVQAAHHEDCGLLVFQSPGTPTNLSYSAQTSADTNL